MRQLLIFSVVIVVVAVALPKYLAGYVEQPKAAEVSATGSEPTERKPSRQHRSSPMQVEIQAERDGHFYVDADINMQPVRLIVDTGATVVALRESDADAAGVRVRPSDFIHPVQTANGTTNAAATMLQSISVNDIEVRNVRAMIIPDEQLSMSLLGGSFLHSLKRFEVENGTLIFEN